MTDANRLFYWGEHYKLGVEEVDRQHEQLAGLLNGIYDASLSGKPRAELESMLGRFVLAFRKHCRTEERLMRQAGYPRLDVHRREHKSLVRELLALEREFSGGRANLDASTLNLLKDSVREHMLIADKRFGQFLDSRPRR